VKRKYNWVKNTELTRKQFDVLRDLWRRRIEDRESTADLAAEIGLSPTTLCMHWKRLGYSPQEAYLADRQSTERDLLVYHWRAVEKLTFDQCAARLGWEVTPSNRTKLRNSFSRFCASNKMTAPVGWHQTEKIAISTYELRMAKLSWNAIAEKLGFPVEHKVTNRLRMGMVNYCKREGLAIPVVGPTRAEKVSVSERAYALRLQGLSWGDVAMRLENTRNESVQHKLRVKVSDYAKRRGLPLPHGQLTPNALEANS
jgi:hypothetical protein